ncbi:hypothetical protein M8494_06100 [Serratia ureilytica]
MSGAATSPTPEPARDRPTPCAGSDRPPGAHFAARLDDPNKPVGVFLPAGRPASARPKPRWRWRKTLYGGEQNVITINMSEFRSRTPFRR